jgi:hypothetical protein
MRRASSHSLRAVGSGGMSVRVGMTQSFVEKRLLRTRSATGKPLSNTEEEKVRIRKTVTDLQNSGKFPVSPYTAFRPQTFGMCRYDTRAFVRRVMGIPDRKPSLWSMFAGPAQPTEQPFPQDLRDLVEMVNQKVVILAGKGLTTGTSVYTPESFHYVALLFTEDDPLGNPLFAVADLDCSVALDEYEKVRSVLSNRCKSLHDLTSDEIRDFGIAEQGIFYTPASRVMERFGSSPDVSQGVELFEVDKES